MVFVQGALAIASKVGPNLFPLGRIIKVARSGYKITNSTNPLTVASNITLTQYQWVQLPILWVKYMTNVKGLFHYNVWIIKK